MGQTAQPPNAPGLKGTGTACVCAGSHQSAVQTGYPHPLNNAAVPENTLPVEIVLDKAVRQADNTRAACPAVTLIRMGEPKMTAVSNTFNTFISQSFYFHILLNAIKDFQPAENPHRKDDLHPVAGLPAAQAPGLGS